jgi:1-phosphatidylinositol phosphodiesterase
MNFINQSYRVFFALALLALPCVGRAQAAPAPPPSLPLSDWMSRIDGTTKLGELSIPGSHDTCALHEPFPGTARCQALSLREQLETGVRFLDIRCRHVHDEFKIFHGSADQRASFSDVLSVCSTFLTNHPTECILMSIQQEYKPDANTRPFEQTFDAYVNGYTNLWYLNDRIPTLDEARGKIVLFRRFPAATVPKGIAASDWCDNTNFWIGNAIRVQDNYVVRDKLAKWKAIEALFQEMNIANHDVLYLNFTSGYEPQIFGIPNITAVSDYINSQLSSYLQSANPQRRGIVIMDFVDAPRCALVVEANCQ